MKPFIVIEEQVVWTKCFHVARKTFTVNKSHKFTSTKAVPPHIMSLDYKNQYGLAQPKWPSNTAHKRV